MPPKRNAALSNLLDQATAREERAAQLAAHYSQQAAKQAGYLVPQGNERGPVLAAKAHMLEVTT
ncbi:MAG: hypothetical protein WAZ19_12690 [Anaerolineae bacterium]